MAVLTWVGTTPVNLNYLTYDNEEGQYLRSLYDEPGAADQALRRGLTRTTSCSRWATGAQGSALVLAVAQAWRTAVVLVSPELQKTHFKFKVVASDLLFGNQIGLVTTVQGRNNARLIFAGSLDLFSDKYMDDKQFANAEFADAVTKWGFQESGVLRMTNVKHYREDGSQPAKMLSDANRGDQPITLYPDAEVARDSLVYRVKGNLTYSLDLHELKDGKWVPYKTDDVQLEFVMLAPHAPDVYGIFLFRVMYRRLGLSTIYTTTQVSLRPFKHDEYERFIPAAYPYYASALHVGLYLHTLTPVAA
ncbi:hypothetical protein PHYSODRAFT_247235 [Phytophthora sojae]|uniref:Dolichyl-diphosphooligosaccharide--protein glycosyltransferase 48 kDa subunit n=1 Tax=Phytophthora sojae (strain P6497) TaxID=1094619 RepID=G5AGJ9_PHYSP|nr:hypothetical protein PHYSODRAFT_247235 [Phytophthora sojae]EGZ05279.1 hypothetical protein PHYSODRAFT_247235 [Phytophthora sojae]|eukprot:XP_009539200.1 hypothetical protein PHYSODRAFT_247235 [Phytophthora sojae]